MARDRGIVEVLTELRDYLTKRGAKAIRGLGRAFRSMDSFDGNRKVDRQEFATGLAEFGINLSKNDAQVLFAYFDRDGDGTICFDEFLVGVRGKPSTRRQALIDKAFLKFDRDGNGYIDVNDLRGVYNTAFHPKVRSGQITEDQALAEFLGNFNDRNRDGRIQKEEWDEYYASVSSSIDHDEHFVQLMKMAWGLD